MAISLSYVLKYINNNDLVDFTHNSIRCLRKDVMFVFHYVKFKIFKACSYIDSYWHNAFRIFYLLRQQFFISSYCNSLYSIGTFYNIHINDAEKFVIIYMYSNTEYCHNFLLYCESVNNAFCLNIRSTFTNDDING